MKRLDIADLDSTVAEIDLNQTSTTDVYVFKTADGLTLKTITITYTDSGKGTIQNVKRS